MKRREFLTGAIGTAAGLAGIAGMSSLAAAAEGEDVKREYFEFRKYYLHVGSKKRLVGDFLRDVGIPAMNRIGIEPVGAFSAIYGPNSPTLYVLLVHKSLDSVVSSASLLMADKEYLKAGAEFINAPLAEPTYVRMESSLMVAFRDMPKLEVPEKGRGIFELRTYESHSIKAAKKKIEMFNEGGEIAIFKKTGLQPVFFGETIIGPKMPNLTYMLVFENMADRDKKWGIFSGDPDWKKLSANTAYKDTVSNITDIILRPESYSQI
ncbi:MAG: NIPSNAP family protein [Sedimentisphaerales bacterium]